VFFFYLFMLIFPLPAETPSLQRPQQSSQGIGHASNCLNNWKRYAPTHKADALNPVQHCFFRLQIL
jgi:hypothetical protein